MATRSMFPEAGAWLRGATHVHTTRSDGELTPAEAVRCYADLGYDFICLTDHWQRTAPPRPRTDGPLVIPGTELHVSPAGNDFHLVVLGLPAAAGLPPSRTLPGIGRWARTHGLALVLAHPYWSGTRSEHLLRVPALLGVEVYNTHCDTTLAKGYAGVYWDDLLDAGRRVFGFAVDDLHAPRWGLGGGWIMVKAPAPTRTAVLGAIRAGHFYATQGPRVHELCARGREVELSCSPVRRIHFVANRSQGHVVAAGAADLTGARWTAPRSCRYVRIECLDAAGRMAWSNAIFFNQAQPAAHLSRPTARA